MLMILVKFDERVGEKYVAGSVIRGGLVAIAA
jgi:hypothetical protein